MIKKFTIIVLLFCAVISCGKKGDPEYKQSIYKYGFYRWRSTNKNSIC